MKKIFFLFFWVLYLTAFGNPKSSQVQPVSIESYLSNSELDYWFGVYAQGNKIGYCHMELKDLRKSEIPIVEISFHMTLEMKHEEQLNRMKIKVVERFSGESPYQFLLASEETLQLGEAEEKERVEISRLSKAGHYRARILQGGTNRSKSFKLDYDLLDFFAEDLWILGSPKVGDTFSSELLDTELLRMITQKSTVKEKKTGVFNGVETTYYVISSEDEEGVAGETVILEDGTPVKLVVGGFFELRLESEEIAKQLDEPVDLFVENLVRLEGRIEDPTKVKRMVVVVDSGLGKALADAPGQRVFPEPKGNGYRVTITSDNEKDIRVTEKEKSKALESSVSFPLKHPRILQLAGRATRNAKSRREKVDSLVSFVDKYLEDSYTAEPLTVLDTIKRKKGDCSEHSALFAALARSLGIPTRVVSGLIYSEDGAFGAHAWNEVAIDGFWVPVDSTWNERTTNATHIRFPVKWDGEFRAYGRLSKAGIKLIDLKTGQ
jgi:hypothetical protein